MNPRVNRRPQIYFCGSVTGGRDQIAWYQIIVEEAEKYGNVLTKHIASPEITSLGETNISPREVWQRDRDWLARAEMVIAEVTQVSTGVGYEIGVAEGKLPILCLYREIPGKRLSGMLAGNPKVMVEKYATEEELRTAVGAFCVSCLRDPAEDPMGRGIFYS